MRQGEGAEKRGRNSRGVIFGKIGELLSGNQGGAPETLAKHRQSLEKNRAKKKNTTSHAEPAQETKIVEITHHIREGNELAPYEKNGHRIAKQGSGMVFDRST